MSSTWSARPALARGDVIVAPLTASGPAPVTVVRLSGPEAGLRDVADILELGPWPAPRQVALRVLRIGERVVDEALITHFPAPRSYTGESVLEIAAHGNPVLISGLIESCIRAGARAAEPGEFTRRAVESGRMVLPQAEALDALLRAQSEEGLALARRLLDGALVRACENLKATLLAAAAAVEAVVDFPDDVSQDDARPFLDTLPAVRAELLTLQRGASAARARLHGLRVVLYGPVNAGKSTLFNTLLGEARAIVHKQPGTTRDVLTAPLSLGGFAFQLHDVAGDRDGVDDVERIGIERGRALRDAAELPISVRDARGIEAGEAPGTVIAVATHGDLIEPLEAQRLLARGWIVLAPGDNTALDRLRGALVRTAQTLPNDTLLHTARQVAAVGAAAASLEDAIRFGFDEPILCAQVLRVAMRALDELAGRFHDEQVYDALFATFCIGK